jgi:hypothetical protein
LELAAFSSRLPHDKMTFEEVNLFHDIVDEDGSACRNTTQMENYKTFLFIRNKIVICYFLFKLKAIYYLINSIF